MSQQRIYSNRCENLLHKPHTVRRFAACGRLQLSVDSKPSAALRRQHIRAYEPVHTCNDLELTCDACKVPVQLCGERRRRASHCAVVRRSARQFDTLSNSSEASCVQNWTSCG